MISVGIFTGYYPYTLAETIERAKKDGMSCVQLDLEFKDIDLSRGNITKEKANQVRDAFRDANFPIVVVFPTPFCLYKPCAPGSGKTPGEY